MIKKILLAIIFLGIFIFAFTAKKQTGEKEYATQVLDQYIRYYCPNAGTCTRKKALSRLKSDWPHVYKLGFQALEK